MALMRTRPRGAQRQSRRFARLRRCPPTALSKLVTQLEGRLGVRLVNRSTRKFQLTAEGAAFYERSVKVQSTSRNARTPPSDESKPPSTNLTTTGFPLAGDRPGNGNIERCSASRSTGSAQKFLSTHAAVYNTFNGDGAAD